MLTELIGYADRISVTSGETIAFKVSTDLAYYDATIVRLIHGDANGPGYKEEVVSPVGSYAGRKQHAYAGSYGLVDGYAGLSLADGFTIQAWICPTTPAKGVQGIVAQWSANAGYALVISEAGDLAFWLGDGTNVHKVGSGTRLRDRQWYFVAVSYDPATGTVRLRQAALSNLPQDQPVTTAVSRPGIGLHTPQTPLTFAALSAEPSPSRHGPARGLYNGKIDRPMILRRPLADAEIVSLQREGNAERSGALVAQWDFSAEIASSALVDIGPNRLHGRVMNMPMRAVTGHNWTGDEIDFKHAPGQYGAIHFHDDDIEDAGWETDFTWQVPAYVRSGFYAARLQSGDHEDHIPFFVRPPGGVPRARAVVLVPTFTYLAYSNETHRAMPRHQAVYTKRAMMKDRLDLYLDEHREFGISLYDVHSDGSGSCHSSYLRPIPSLRPKYRQWQFGCPRHLAADLYLIDWLEQTGLDYDVVTDHDLHMSGQSLLAPYSVVITGTHPEYWSRQMREAMAGYLDAGGRQMYLGGNGYYWVTSLDPERPHVIEVRKGIAGTRAWNSAPGELYHSSTGELGGLWRHRGKPPNQIVGVGFKAMGYDAPTPGYRRQPGSLDLRASFIFDGLGNDEIIGNFGLALGGAAGDELDRIDFELGTPPHTLLLASASGYSAYYVPVVEDHNEMSDIVIAEQRSLVRADMVYFETNNGGAVFSTGSITWCGSLSHNSYDNNVSRITENVLRHFIR